MCRCPMKGKTLGVAAVSLMLLCVCFLGSTKSPLKSSSNSQSQVQGTRRTLIGRQGEVELLGSEIIQQDADGDSEEESFYMPWLEQDFAVWEDAGIKQVWGPPAQACPLPRACMSIL